MQTYTIVGIKSGLYPELNEDIVKIENVPADKLVEVIEEMYRNAEVDFIEVWKD